MKIINVTIPQNTKIILKLVNMLIITIYFQQKHNMYENVF